MKCCMLKYCALKSSVIGVVSLRDFQLQLKFRGSANSSDVVDGDQQVMRSSSSDMCILIKSYRTSSQIWDLTAYVCVYMCHIYGCNY